MANRAGTWAEVYPDRRITVEIKDSQYQAAAKILASAVEALRQAISGLQRKEESGQLRRRLDEVDGIIKRAKRELRIN